MKYMILMYGSQRDYDEMAGHVADGKPAWSASDNPVVALNHAVAVAMTRGPRAGPDLLGRLEADRRIAGDHRLEAVRAHLLEMAGQPGAARDAYRAAAARTASLPHQRYLNARAARLTGRA